ncbi:MAG: caspase family protein [Acidobacteria bacterium]|nr:caspase family protein [Acidobacteriota bacterium]
MKWIWLLAGVLCAQQSRDVKWEAASAANPLRDKGTRWALVVGISQHANLGSGAQLQFAHRDAEEFAGFLLSAGGGALPPSQVKLLTNEKATLGAIRAELHGWLPNVAGPGDVVYVFFAGHGVVAERGEAYFVAHDSDPQNLHATGLGFREVEETLARRLRAGQVVLLADSCHAGQLGTAGFAPAGEELEKFGDRSVLKLLAGRPSERAFEDARWNAGVFTHMLLEGLRGGADADGDRVVRVGEAIEYVTKRVAAETGARQNPRVAGQFDGQLALAVVGEERAGGSLALEVRGPVGAGVWVDHLYRGSLGRGGTIRVDGLAVGVHVVGSDVGVEGRVNLSTGLSVVRLAVAGDERRAAELETAGQACVADYVASTAAGPKRALLTKAVQSLTELRQLRPWDTTVETRRLFCLGRLQIAGEAFQEAEQSLRASLARDPQFACARNALGVALGRLGRGEEARAQFVLAAELTQEGALPLVQIGNQMLAGGKVKEAVGYYERAVRLSPGARGNRALLVRGYRMAGRTAEARRGAEELIQLDATYAPGHLELARTLEAQGDGLGAAKAYEAYLLLAPNYGDSEEIRVKTQRLRTTGSGAVPTLRKK